MGDAVVLEAFARVRRTTTGRSVNVGGQRGVVVASFARRVRVDGPFAADEFCWLGTALFHVVALGRFRVTAPDVLVTAADSRRGLMLRMRAEQKRTARAGGARAGGSDVSRATPTCRERDA